MYLVKGLAYDEFSSLSSSLCMSENAEKKDHHCYIVLPVPVRHTQKRHQRQCMRHNHCILLPITAYE